MKNQRWIAGPLVAALAMGVTGAALHAQPNPNNAPKAQNPPNQAPGGRRGGRPDFGNLTPEQRQQFEQQMQQMRELGMRQMLTGANVTDKAVQDAVIAFANQQDQTRRTLRESMRKVSEALRNDAVTDAQLATLLADFRADVAAEKDRREAALKDLNEKIGYTKNARLDAVLTL